MKFLINKGIHAIIAKKGTLVQLVQGMCHQRFSEGPKQGACHDREVGCFNCLRKVMPSSREVGPGKVTSV